MCLAVPGKIKKLLDEGFVVADFMGVQKTVAVDLLDDYAVGDYVIVHAGFAIEKLDQDEALENIEYFKELLASVPPGQDKA